MTNNRHQSPVAVVGVSFRLPGANGEGLWDALLAGRDLVTSVAPDRWSQDALLHPNKNEPGTSFTFAAGSIGDIAGFDAAFFGISPREAEQMDPQQRILLEMAWEAFEQAGIPPSSMRGSRCGVYVGLSSVDYAHRRADDLGAIQATTMTGGAGSIAANRLSYLFDLHGPSMVIDTACSSSLVAFHQACQSIRHGETDAALVGGISLHLHPYGFVGFSKASMLSRQGRCNVFGADADGYVRSEGGGVLILKPLHRALADGNRILAVVAGTGVNSDGRKAGLTVPSHTAQAALLREVYGRAGIAPADINYYEAHGTGTAVGDPVETRAIGEALGRARPSDNPLPVGSIKGNVGHLEAAAGIAGLVKALFVLRDRLVPANVHLSTANPHIDFPALNLAPVTQPFALAPDGPLIVGVSAFGFGGTNAHVILKSLEGSVAKPSLRAVPDEVLPSSALLLSARSPAALRDSARQMAELVRSRHELPLDDIIHSAAAHRDVHAHRLSASAADRPALAIALDRFAATGAADGVIEGRLRTEASAPAFIYSGNGSQWAGMGAQLLEEEGTFLDAVTEVDALYVSLCGESILATLRAPPDADRFSLTEVAQPALFALQVGLTRVFECRGIRPIAVCGHSVGEVAAAWASGALNLTQAVRVIHARSMHQATTRGRGCMTAATLAFSEAQALLEKLGFGVRLEVAAVNSPLHVTVAGDADAMTCFEAALTQRRIVFQRLGLDYAFHSAAMDPIRARLLESLRGLKPNAMGIPMYSSVTGTLLVSSARSGDLDASYWWRNVREAVRFEAAIRAMVDSGVNTFIEIGPRAVLASYLAEITKPLGPGALVLPSLTRKDSGGAAIRTLIAKLQLAGTGCEPWQNPPVRGRFVDLPHYPWQRERYWHPSTAESTGLLTRRIEHPLLGYALAGESFQWENHLDTNKLPVYRDHAVGGGAVFPAAGYVEMALAAACARRRIERRAEDAPLVIEDLEIVEALPLDSDRSCTVRLRLDAAGGRFTIVSRERAADLPWRTLATGRLVDDGVITASAPAELPTRVPDITADAHYEFANRLGLHYGPAFRTVSSAWYRREGVFGVLATPAEIAAETPVTQLHPAYLDGAFQLLADRVPRDRRVAAAPDADLPAFLPVRIDRIELLQSHARVTSALAVVPQSRHRSRRSVRADFTLYDAANAPVAQVHGVRFRAVGLHGTAVAPARWLATRAVPTPRRDTRAVAMPANPDLARDCAARLHAPARLIARRRFTLEIEPLFDALCASFAARALRALTGDQPIDPEALVQSGRVAVSSAPLLRSLLQVLAEDGVVQPMGGQSLWRADTTLPDHEDIWSSLIADYPEYGALAARVGAAGLHLAERLRSGGDMTPSDGGLAWAECCTQEETADVAEALLDVIRRAAAAQPAHVRLRVLRVFGSTPTEGLALLPDVDADRCDVVIGAANNSVLNDIRSRWPMIAGAACHLVDLDRPSLDADALGGGFDLVLLGDGIARAADSARRLRNTRSLLLDGGRLVVLEQQSSRAADLVFGLNPDWWKTREPGAVAWRPRLCAPEAWCELLSHTGFERIEVVRDQTSAPSDPYLMIAQANAPARSATVRSAEPRLWLLLCDGTGYSADLGLALTRHLESHGQRVVTLVAASFYRSIGLHRHALDPHDAAHWDRLLGEFAAAGTAPQGWIHLAGLDPVTAAATAAVRAAAQESRADVLVTWLQACARHTLRPDVWVIGAQCGTALLPAAARAAAGAAPGAGGLRDAALLGIARVAMHECLDQRIRWVDLIDPLPCELNATHLAAELLWPDAEDEILLTATGRYAPRVAAVAAPQPVQSTPPAGETRHTVQLECLVPGSFRNLAWRRAPEAQPLAEDEVEIDVHAAGLNFRDVMYALGVLPDEAVDDGFCGPTLGMEVSGIVTRVGSAVTDVAPADAVLAFAPASFATRVRTRAIAVTRKPAGWTFAAAATVPTAFFTAYYALRELARLAAGERVLIHGGAGGVGIAAIQLAKHLGAEIFATAGSAEKRDFVRLLGADHVFDSRSLAFADEVLQATGGEGVDVVLNSLSGDAIARNLRLLRPFGRMIELGKRDFYEDSQIGLRPFRNNIAYFGIDADQLLAQRPDIARRVFAELMALFADGTLQPLPHRTFEARDISGAFRHMQASRHIGKIVITFPTDFDPLGAVPVAPPLLTLRADATYLVSGGLSGFGLRTARWLVSRGARHLALLSRRGAAATPEAAAQLAQLVAEGISIVAPACDVADAEALRAALALMDATMPPLAGVVHAAMQIEDALIRDLERGQLRRVLAPKMLGAMNLHEATRSRALDFFVMYSSATTLFGNPGQAAYVAANIGLEALADERRALGLPATCIGWGPIQDTGYLARNERVMAALLGRMGGRALPSGELLQALESAIGASAGNLGFLDLDWSTLRDSLPASGAPKFADLARLANSGERGAHAGESAQDLRRRLGGLGRNELLTELTAIVRAEAAEILGFGAERIEPAASLPDLGMDSLMAVELATSIESRLDVRLSALALGGGTTIETIVERIVRMLQPDADSDADANVAAADSGEVANVAAQLRLVTAQHAEDLSAETAAQVIEDIQSGGPPALSLTRAVRA